MSDANRLDLTRHVPGDHAKTGSPERQVLQRMAEAVGMDPAKLDEEDSLIGFFQSFRPDGRGLQGVFDEFPAGEQLHNRLDQLFAAAGDDRRPQGGRDAYFVVRRPPPLEPDAAREAAEQWLTQTAQLASMVGRDAVNERLGGVSHVRVLEGIAPKQPRQPEDKTELWKTLHEEVPQLVEAIEPHPPLASALRPAYYFIHCDAMLRDYLMWPIYQQACPVEDPFAAYFLLWRHGVKVRVFTEGQVDLYLPRV